MPVAIKGLLDRSRQELLDLSTRNRLLSIPVDSKSARIIQVHDERSDQVYRQLIVERKSLSFLPTRPSRKKADNANTELFSDVENEEEIGLPQPDSEEILVNGVAKKHVDLRLQTALTPEGLQRRVLDLYHDALTAIEEQGVNILYLVLGHLKWYEANHSDTPRYAPLLLIPIELHRKSAADRFYIRWREEDIEENLSLAARLKQDFSIEFPPLEDTEDLNPMDYFDSIKARLGDDTRWEILPDAMTVGFFSFAKLLMYRDLDADTWGDPKRLLGHPLISALLQDGFPSQGDLIGEDTNLDEIIPAMNLDHVVDADSSQTIAIEHVRRGLNTVVQGPPGTGKSQSITNIIANAVLDGKKVLFVAEKLAALQVVKRRLEVEGLGPLCLELHSNRSKKREVIEEIGRTWKLGRPRSENLEYLVKKLEELRGKLNSHANSIHEPHSPSGLSPFRVIGELAYLGDKGKQGLHLNIDGSESWTKQDRRERSEILKEIIERVRRMGSPSRYPWRGVRRDMVLPIDLPIIESAIHRLSESLALLANTSTKVSQTIGRPKPDILDQVDKERLIVEYVGKTPEIDKRALADRIWDAGVDTLDLLIQTGQAFESYCNELSSKVKETAWQGDLSTSRRSIANHGKSLFRIFNREYRSSIEEFKNALNVPLPKTFPARQDFLEKIIAGQKAYRFISEHGAEGKRAFGAMWHDDKSNWAKLETIIEWFRSYKDAGLEAGFQIMVSNVEDTGQCTELGSNLQEQLSATRVATHELVTLLDLDVNLAFGKTNLESVPFDQITSRCAEWLQNMESLSVWNNYFVRAERARSLGLAPIVDEIASETLSPSDAIDCFDRIYLSQLLRSMVALNPELARFDGELHGGIVEEFRKVDKDRRELGKYRVLQAHYGQMPPNSGIGQAGIVRSEMERKRGHRSVRRLLRDAGSVVQAIKPVFMMSPLSVAQFLEPGAVEFDLLVIDEASQVQPVDALGAVVRCKQLVVVGDQKQLPPTRFFLRLTSDYDDPDEDESIETAEAKDIESILGLCRARGLKETMLRWHYRSRHHSLIAVSNHVFYNDRLFIVPSPYSSTARLGVKFNYVSEGVFDSGGSRSNQIEAQMVCRAIMDHARNFSHLSLGVATFSVNQRQAILDELELLRRENPDLEPFFADHSAEPFFVKNLENVQGDERDIIFISIGYGRNVHGYMAMRFGPLSNEGGERRLNVLISRSKQRCEVFSSITADDIDLERASGAGVVALKTFLSFAQTGRIAIAKQTGMEEASPFEEAVKQGIESLGYEVHTQIGIAGFFVDLAIVDRDRQGRYVLGIECDGAAYHSSRSARDRDRLRQSVLEQHGWIIHRVWSTDWFQRPAEQLRKVQQAISQAQLAYDSISAEEASRLRETDELVIEREPTILHGDGSLLSLSVPYSEARFSVPKHYQPHELGTKRMAEVVWKIVEHEGPVHEDEVVNRVRDLWGLGRAGSRIQDSVAKAIRSLLTRSVCKRKDGFLSTPNGEAVPRNREKVSSNNLRRPEMIPPAEISATIIKLVEVHHGATREEIPNAVARLLGFKSTSTQLRRLINANLNILLRCGDLTEVDSMIELADHEKVD